MDRTKTAILASLNLLAATSAGAAVLKVPGQYRTITDAVTASSAGDTIEIGPGDYRESVLIENRERLTLRGRGRARLLDDTSSSLLIVTGSREIKISNLILDFPRAYGVVIQDSSTVQVKNCTIRGIGNTGIVVDENSVGAFLQGNRISGSQSHGIVCFGTSAIISKNRIKKCGDLGIYAEGRLASIVDNRVSNVREIGLFVEASRSLVQGNRVKRTDEDGIYVTGLSDSSFLENTVRDSGGAGIRIVEDSYHANFFDNSVARSAANGIVLAGHGHVVGRNRVGRTLGRAGILVIGGDNLLSGNAVRDAAGQGLSLLGGDNTVTRNKMRGSGLFDLYVQSSFNVLFQNRYRTTNL